MKKLLILLATATVALSSVSFAAAKSDEVLQAIPGNDNGNPTVVADASNDASATATPAQGQDATATAQDTAKKPAKKHKKHKKHKKQQQCS